MTVCRLITADPLYVRAHTGARVEVGPIAPGAAEGLHQRFRPLADIDDLALGIEPESHRGLLVTGMVERELVVEDHLRGRIEFLHLHIGRDRLAGCGDEM